MTCRYMVDLHQGAVCDRMETPSLRARRPAVRVWRAEDTSPLSSGRCGLCLAAEPHRPSCSVSKSGGAAVRPANQFPSLRTPFGFRSLAQFLTALLPLGAVQNAHAAVGLQLHAGQNLDQPLDVL